MKKVTVLGGGLAGVEAAIQARKRGFAVELISERDFLFIYPLAIWIPVSKINSQKVRIPLESIARKHGFSYVVDKVTNLNLQMKTVTTEKRGSWTVENLIVALGADKVSSIDTQNTLSVCGDPNQLEILRERIEALIARGEGRVAFGFGGNPKDSSAVRGGPAFELFFNLDHKLRKLGLREKFELTFFAPMAEPGLRMGEKAFRAMAKMFQSYNLKTRYGKKIKDFEKSRVIFEDDSFLEADLIMYVPAGEGCALVRSSDLPLNEAGFIRINKHCQIEGSLHWYAIGDCAALQGPDWKAKQGHLAEIMADVAASNLEVSNKKSGTLKSYEEHIHILCIMDMGNGAGLVFRDQSRQLFLPLPIVGHWLKILWGVYYKMTKRGFSLH